MRKSLAKIVAGVACGAALAVSMLAAPGPVFAEDVPANEMHRMYNPYTGEHFYTANTNERDQLQGAGWKYEGVAWKAPKASDKPVYRLYNSYVKGGDHHYTMDANERDTLIKAGWTNEGIGWYSADPYPNGDPILRQYNPFATTGAHNYTASRAERDSLTKTTSDTPWGYTPSGSYIPYAWLNESVAWYGIKGSTGENYDARPCNHIIVQAHYVDENGKAWPECIICGMLFSTLA